MFDHCDEIAALEQELEALADRVEQCRKVALIAKAMIVAGGALLVLLLTGALGRSPSALVIAFAAFLGGVALHGTNRSTLDEIRGTIRKLESCRAELIGAMELRLVPT